MSLEREPIGVIGAGYVGLVTAAGFAQLGSEVWCVDTDAGKVDALNAGRVPIYEPGLEELLQANAARLHFSTEPSEALAHARLLFVAVGTPPTASGDADLSAVHAVIDAISRARAGEAPAGEGPPARASRSTSAEVPAPAGDVSSAPARASRPSSAEVEAPAGGASPARASRARAGEALDERLGVLAEDGLPRARAEHAIVMKSTVPCGTGASILRDLAQAGLASERDPRVASLTYVSCPEFLKEGSAVKDFTHPDRVVIGDRGDWAGDAVARLYEPLQAPVLRTDIASAEMIKLAANAFLATKISFINEIANVCEEVGADVGEVARGMGLDARIGPSFLHAGIGYGGSCFTKDVSALKLLAGNSGYHFQLLSAVIEVNDLQKRRVVAKLQRRLGELSERRIALLGLAFKPNTDDMRGASSLVLAGRLQAEGALVRAIDPVAESEARRLMPTIEYASSPLQAVADADAAILVTEWPELVALDWHEVAAAMRGNLVIDGRNALDADAVRAAGLTYEGMGRQ